MTGSADILGITESIKRYAPQHVFEKKTDFEAFLELGTIVRTLLQASD
jgi:hypothetical protein